MKITKKKIVLWIVIVLFLFDLGICVAGETYGTHIYSFTQNMYCSFNKGIYTRIRDDNCCICPTGTEGEYNCFQEKTYNKECG